jgi:hypothetical protein
MQIDTLRALFTYIAALIILIGGGFILYATYADDRSANLLVMVGGFMGAAIQFLFGQEIATRTARQSTAATLAAQVNGSGIAPNPGLLP